MNLEPGNEASPTRRLELTPRLEPAGATPILIGPGALAVSAKELHSTFAGRRVFLVTEPRVWGLHAEALDPLLEPAANVTTLEVSEGEAAKSPETLIELWGSLLRDGGKRDSLVLGFGGGAVGDLAGFAAATFLRGVDFVQVPTTLLAQVDASVGGKTGINLPDAKNSLGAFLDPRAVIADTALLATLPQAELRSGLVEVIKMAALLDLELLDRVERDLDALLGADAERLAPVVEGAIAAKIRVVERDPREAGPRKLLNFGHTLGHALESVGGYGGMRHGEAVGWGLLFAIRLAGRRGFPRDEAARLEDLVRRLELPPLPIVEADRLLWAMSRDKKRREAGLTWVLPLRLGEGRLVDDLPEEEVRSELESFLASHSPNCAGL